jgi:hypothetical protein
MMTPISYSARVSASWVRARLARWHAVPGHDKIMVLASFAASVGAGLYITGASVYFVHSVGLSADRVATGLAAAALLGLASGVPVGKLADRLGARNLTIALMLLGVPVLAVLTQVRSFWAFLPAAAALGVPIMGAEVARGALMAQVSGPAGAPRLAVYTRSAFNAGFSAGLLGAGAAISIGTRPAFLCLFAGDAASIILACLLFLALPRDRPEPATISGPQPGKGSVSALRDVPYLLVAQISGLTRLGDTILTVGLPLWVVTRTAAPRGLAAWLLIANTFLVVALQVRVTRRAVSTAGAAQLQQWAFLALALACLIISPSSRLGAFPATGVLLAGTVLLTFGEMWGEGAWWSLRYNLAAPSAQGSYGAAFALGQAGPSVLGPVLVTSLAVSLGGPGWLILTAIFLIFAALSRRPVTWAATHSMTPKSVIPGPRPEAEMPASVRRPVAP